MKKEIAVGLGGLAVIALLCSALPQLLVSTEHTSIEITQNLEEDGWYWTQFILPSGGELMGEITLQEQRSVLPGARKTITRSKFKGTLFVGKFCCGETITQQYVFLPTDDVVGDYDNLVFFAEDGSVWRIPVPEEIRTPAEGMVTTTATVYQ
jgi:hypothetical protein